MFVYFGFHLSFKIHALSLFDALYFYLNVSAHQYFVPITFTTAIMPITPTFPNFTATIVTLQLVIIILLILLLILTPLALNFTHYLLILILVYLSLSLVILATIFLMKLSYFDLLPIFYVMDPLNYYYYYGLVYIIKVLDLNISDIFILYYKSQIANIYLYYLFYIYGYQDQNQSINININKFQ